MKSSPLQKGKKKKKTPQGNASKKEKTLFKTLLEIGQSHILQEFTETPLDTLRIESLENWVQQLELFFQPMGGLIGMQKKIGELLYSKEKNIPECTPFEPKFLKFEKEKWLKGIYLQQNLLEIVVLGGAAERLNFVDEWTGEPLPAFLYPFLGKPLLEWILLDIESKERLYFEYFQKTILTPILFMTSASKKNRDLLEQFLESKNYFNRPKESFHFTEQPLVPYVDRSGKWCLDSFKNVDKGPCGHGAIWSLLVHMETFQGLKKEKTHALIRQINNPLLCFFESLPLYTEAAIESKSDFSLLVTDCATGTKEGKIVQKKGGGFTNIEYVHVEQNELEGYANVNAIMVKLETIEQHVHKDPYPGLLLNFKNEEKARLEMSMQNLVDVIDGVLVCHLPRELALAAIKKGGKGIETAEEASLLLLEVLKKYSFQKVELSELTPYISRKYSLE